MNATATKIDTTETRTLKGPRRHKDRSKKGLRRAQMRILTVLSIAEYPIDRQTLSEWANVPETHIIGFTLIKYKSKASAALAELGLAKEVMVKDEDTGRSHRCFAITAKGRKTIQQLLADEAGQEVLKQTKAAIKASLKS